MAVIWQWAGMFVAVGTLDFIWVQFAQTAADRRPLMASIWSAGIYALGGVTTMLYVKDHLLLLPALAGAIVGTYISVKAGE